MSFCLRLWDVFRGREILCDICRKHLQIALDGSEIKMLMTVKAGRRLCSASFHMLLRKLQEYASSMSQPGRERFQKAQLRAHAFEIHNCCVEELDIPIDRPCRRVGNDVGEDDKERPKWQVEELPPK